jgi:hypothetical protein
MSEQDLAAWQAENEAFLKKIGQVQQPAPTAKKAEE